MKSGDEPTQSAAHTKPTVIARNASDEVECSKCHMYFGIKGAIEAHEKRHANHTDDELYKFQHPKDYTVESKQADGKVDQFRKQKGLELALKKEVIEPVDTATNTHSASIGVQGISTGNASNQMSAPIATPQGTGTST